MTVSLTAIMLSRDEAIHIRRAIESVQLAGGRVFLVDSGSRDDTVAIASAMGAEIAHRPWTNYAEQFAWAMQACPIDSDWYCRLDCDEYLTAELAAELQTRLPTLGPSVAGLAAKRRLVFQGRWMRHGGLYPAWMVRFWRRGRARIETVMDEHMIVDGGAIADLRHDFVDDNRKPLEAWAAKHLGYAAREAADVLAGDRGEPAGLEPRARAVRRRKHDLYYRLPPVSRAYAFWLYRYLLRGGFRDGPEGWLFHLLQGLWYRTLVDVRIRDLKAGWPYLD